MKKKIFICILIAVCVLIGVVSAILFVNKSKENKAKAMEIGRACKQISILKWSNMSLAYC